MCLPSDVAYNYPYNIIVCHMSINCIAYAYPYISAFLLAIVTTNSYSWLLCYYDLHARLLSLYYCAYVLSILSVLSAHINLFSSDLSQSNSNSNSSFFFTFNSVSALSISALPQFQLQLQPRHCAFGPGDLELDRVYVYLTFELFWICIRPNSSQRVNVVTHSLLLCGVLLVAGHVPALRFFPAAMILSFTGVLLIYGSLEARTLHLRISDSTRLFSTWCRHDPCYHDLPPHNYCASIWISSVWLHLCASSPCFFMSWILPHQPVVNRHILFFFTFFPYGKQTGGKLCECFAWPRVTGAEDAPLSHGFFRWRNWWLHILLIFDPNSYILP